MAFLVHLLDKFFRFQGTSWHKWLHSTCSKLHIVLLARKVDITLFKSTLIWEPEVSRFIAKTSGELFADIGACYGRYILLLGKKYKQIIAVEPNPQNIQTIKSNVEYAGLKNVKLIEAAASDKDGHANLYLGSKGGHHTLYSNKHREKITVKTLTLASLLRDRCVDLVKVDVEGAERQVLKGAEPIVERIRSWIVEAHNRGDKAELEKWFISHSYSIKWLGSRHIYATQNNLL